jgi:hypothetical protein
MQSVFSFGIRPYITAAALGLITCAVALNASAATIVATDISGAPGDAVTSQLKITDLADLEAVNRLDSLNLTLVYDTTRLDFLSAGNGAVLEAAGPADAVESPAGTVALGFLAKTGGVSLSVNDVLGELNFKILESAPQGQVTALNLSDIALLSDVTDLFPGNSSASLTVVPLPPVLTLFLTAMGSAAAFLRRRRPAGVASVGDGASAS